jgi:hypothetical protein
MREAVQRRSDMPRLTLSAKKDVIEKAKRIACDRGISVSELFCLFVNTLGSPREDRRTPAPITRRLRGLAKLSADKSDRESFEEAIGRSED